MYTLAEIFENRIPSLKSFDPMGLVKNFESSIKKELDFIHESVNIQRFANHLKEDDHDRTSFPSHGPRAHRLRDAACRADPAGARDLVFNDSLERLELSDLNVAGTVLSNPSGASWGRRPRSATPSRSCGPR